MKLMRTLTTAAAMTLALTLLTGIIYPLLVLGARAGDFSVAGEWQPDHA